MGLANVLIKIGIPRIQGSRLYSIDDIYLGAVCSIYSTYLIAKMLNVNY